MGWRRGRWGWRRGRWGWRRGRGRRHLRRRHLNLLRNRSPRAHHLVHDPHHPDSHGEHLPGDHLVLPHGQRGSLHRASAHAEKEHELPRGLHELRVFHSSSTTTLQFLHAVYLPRSIRGGAAAETSAGADENAAPKLDAADVAAEAAADVAPLTAEVRRRSRSSAACLAADGGARGRGEASEGKRMGTRKRGSVVWR